MASYKGQTKTAYTEALKRAAADLASQPVCQDDETVIETESKQAAPKKRGRPAKIKEA